MVFNQAIPFLFDYSKTVQNINRNIVTNPNKSKVRVSFQIYFVVIG